MKVSRKSDYALRVLFTLVEYYGRGPIPIRELARRNEIPRSFLEHIMLDLKSQGWVKSVAGKNGGYVLAQRPTKIKMGQIIRYFDTFLAPIGCVSMTRHERCSQEPVCRFRQAFLKVQNDTARLMDNSSLAAVYSGKTIQPQDDSEEILVGGAGI